MADARDISRRTGIYLMVLPALNSRIRISPMRFQLLVARMALAALILAVLAAAVAVLGVRLGYFPYATGLSVMWPATGLGLVALICAFLWLRSAIARNE